MEIRYGRKRSGIKKELDAKIEEWLGSIKDETVRKVASDNTIVTGGAIASMLLGEKVNDFDIYFKTKEATKVLAEYYVGLFNKANNRYVKVEEESLLNLKEEMEERIVLFVKSAGIAEEVKGLQEEKEPAEAKPEKGMFDIFKEPLEEKGKYRPVFISKNAITLSNKVQLITRFYGEPEEIHDNYDFVHAKCFWDHKNKVLDLPSDALEALLSRTLVYCGSLYPVASIFRMKKFIERGWRITAGQQLKMMWQISEVDLSDHQTLEEQLTGVDMVYMHALVDALEGVDPERINNTYVSTIIDRIFE
jgi:hypothetical protein